MNLMERGMRGPAVLKYLDADYKVVSAGSYVICAVSGVHISLEDLRYWSVDLQEAYATSQVAFQRYTETRKR